MNNKYKRSNELLERAIRVTPLGSQTYSKSFRYFCEGNSPAFLERGEGSHVWDVDGNKYVDFICALGPVTIGYNNPQINHAVIEQLNKGIIFSQAAEVEVLLAEKICQIIPCAEMVRFVKNGSDATSSAIRLARAFTGRDIVAVSGYHGMQDWYIGSTVNNKGIPKAVCELTKTFEYNNIDSLKCLFESYPQKIAAVILEPIQGNGPVDGYLEALKKLTDDNGAILVFDEVVSGFRYALGGAAELYKVSPDITTFGKGMGNGLPISAVAGRKDIMELIGTRGVFISTTFGGEALSIAGALETIKILEEPGTYSRIWKLGNQMIEGLRRQVEYHGLSDVIIVSGLAPHAGVLFEDAGSLDYLDINSVFQQVLIEEGVLSVGINNICLSHTEEDIGKYLCVTDMAMTEVKKAIEKDSIDGILKAGRVNPIFKRNKK